jgi:predicted small metal-binding protein
MEVGMMHKLTAGILAVVLAFAFATQAFAQDPTHATKKEHKTATLKSVSCAPECGFMCRSHDEKELTSIVKAHAKKAHNKDVTDKDVQGMMKVEDAK